MVTPPNVLITGLEGFTGWHLARELQRSGLSPVGLTSDLLDRNAVLSEVNEVAPKYVIHLAAISFAADQRSEAIYSTNVVGTVNLLDALKSLRKRPEKVILASSATVYGATESGRLDEALCPKPVSHYGCSKLAMEHMAQNYFDCMPIALTRPFNYTGTRQNETFLIPKIVNAYVHGSGAVELGNLDVSREFNDVRDVSLVYRDLLFSSLHSDVVNICSGRTVALKELIALMDEQSGSKMDVSVNPAFVRENEIKDLSGCPEKLNSLIDHEFRYSIRDTLAWMYEYELGRKGA